MKQEYRPYVAGLLVSIIWGFSFLFTKGALDIISPFHLLGLRFALAAMLFVTLRILGLIKIDFRGKDPKRLLILTAIQPVSYFIFETLGIHLTSSSETGMMMAAIPVITTILGIIFLKEKPLGIQAGFMLLSVAGVGFNILMKGNIQIGENLLGSFIVLMAVLSAGIFNILSRKFSVDYAPLEITYVMMLTGATVFNVIAVAQHLRQGNLSAYLRPLTDVKALVPIMYLGILASVVAYFLNNYMLSKLEANRASVFSNLITVCSIVAGVTLGNEEFYWYSAVGAGMILLGVWGTNYFSKPKERKDTLSVSQCEE